MFVLLEHTTRHGIHWDLIVELPGRDTLPTWRLIQNPLAVPGEIAAEPIAEHDRRFLEYEGPLREGRGSVRRLDRGEAEVELREARRLVALLGGQWLRGRFELLGGGAGEPAVFRRLDDASGERLSPL